MSVEGIYMTAPEELVLKVNAVRCTSLKYLANYHGTRIIGLDYYVLHFKNNGDFNFEWCRIDEHTPVETFEKLINEKRLYVAKTVVEAYDKYSKS